MLYSRSEYYVRKEEYLRVLSASNIVEALKAVSKDFIYRLTKSIGERYISITTALDHIDSFHINLLNELTSRYNVKDFALNVNGLLTTYGVIIALLSYEKGFKPLSYLPSINTATIEECMGGRKPSLGLDPYSEFMLNLFIDHKTIRSEDATRIYDQLRKNILERANYRERIVLGLMHDLVTLRLCTIDKFCEILWRPLLIDQKDFLNVCRAFSADIYSALESLKKTRPLMSTVSLMAMDAYRIIAGTEILDFLISLAPSYFSTLILRTERTSLFLKDYLFTLRQLSLLRLVLTLISLGDDSLKGYTKTFIERWVSP
ncbi:MAG: hypothetical protein QXE81_03755 [Desulfurococcaceae archaeon]